MCTKEININQWNLLWQIKCPLKQTLLRTPCLFVERPPWPHLNQTLKHIFSHIRRSVLSPALLIFVHVCAWTVGIFLFAYLSLAVNWIHFELLGEGQICQTLACQAWVLSKAETSETLGHLGACPVPSLPVFDARVMNNDASVQLQDSSHLARKRCSITKMAPEVRQKLPFLVPFCLL